MIDRYAAAGAAETLLQRVERDPEAPHYSAQTFHRKLEIDRSRAMKHASRWVCGTLLGHAGGREAKYLVTSELLGVLAAAKLTPNQLITLRAWATGLSFAAIAQTEHTTKQAVQRRFQRALVKIERAYRCYRYVGLAQIYENETRRGSRLSAGR